MRITSNENEELCKDGDGPQNWSGGDIFLYHNNNHVSTLSNGFNDVPYCVELDPNEFQNSFFRLQSTSLDGVCITGIFLNEVQLFVGKNDDKPSFWMENNQTYCLDDYMVTDELTIKNGTVVSSACKRKLEIYFLISKRNKKVKRANFHY